MADEFDYNSLLLDIQRSTTFYEMDDFEKYLEKLIEIDKNDEIAIENWRLNASKTKPKNIIDLFEDDIREGSQTTRLMFKRSFFVSLYSISEKRINKINRTIDSNSKSNYKFDKLKKYFKSKTGIDLPSLDKYTEFNVLRIINNKIKHSDEINIDFDFDNIDDKVLSDLKLDRGKPLDFDKIASNKIVGYTRQFLSDYIKKFEEL